MNRIENLFCQQVLRNPSSLAVKDISGSLTYSELDKLSDRFANFLQKQYQLKPGDFVPILASNKIKEIIVAVLAILKCGATYVPINLKNSQRQVSRILDEIKPEFILFTDEPSNEFDAHSCEYVILQELSDLLENFSMNAPCITPHSNDDKSIAYVAFTSGTTGYSKGVLVSHENLLATFASWAKAYDLQTSDRHLQMANVAFDVFTGDWVRALCSGGTLILCQNDILLQPEKLYELITKEQITFAEFVPAVINRLVDHCLKLKVNLNSIRVMISGSDKWLMKHYLLAKKVCRPNVRIVNSYGTAEATVDSTFYEISAHEDSNHTSLIIPIGKPFPHVKIYLLDDKLQPVTKGEAGEIFIGGVGVSQGYFNNSKLTQERFLEDPFIKRDGAKMYRTGDIGFFLEDGNLVFSGRNQFQVKVNGQRVELADVEAVIAQFPKVESAIVIPTFQENNVTQLSAYMTLKDTNVTYFEIISYLREHMPYYSMPNRLFEVSAMSLTANNKVDKKATMKNVIQEIHPHIQETFSPLETKIINIWKKVLGVTNIDVTNKFLELGGTSLLYISMIDTINNEFGISIPHVMELYTVREIAKYMESLEEESFLNEADVTI